MSHRMKNNQIVKEFKVVVYMTVFILIFMLIISCISMAASFNKLSPFDFGDYSIKNIDDEYVVVTGTNIARVFNTETKTIEEIDIEEYIKGVIASEMPANFDENAIKAQAVAARTYYIAKRLDNCTQACGAEICNSTHCQVYSSKEKNMSKWSKDKAQIYWDKISKAVEDTGGQVLVYNGEIVMYPQFFATSSGKTESAVDVFSRDIPYLKSTESLGEEIAPKYSSVISISSKEFINTINGSYSNTKVTNENIKDTVKVISNTEGGGVKEVALGNEIISGVTFRKLFKLNSANFTIEFSEGTVKVDCKGYGHGVGMSQWGANVMAKEGKKYDEILKHYYSGVDIKEIKFN